MDLFDSVASASAPWSIIPGLHLTITDFSFAISILYVGGIFGALSFGWLSDVIGRRGTFILTLAIVAVGELILGFLVQNYSELIAARLMVGFGVGADFANGPTYLNEFADKARRGSYQFMWGVMSGLGGITIGILAYLMFPLGINEWRYLFLVGAIPCFIGIALRLALPDTPRFDAVRKNDIEKARRTMMSIGLDPAAVTTFKQPELGVRSKFDMMKPYILRTTIPLFLIAMFINIPLTSIGLLSTLYFGTLHLKVPYTALFGLIAFNIPITLGAGIGSGLIDKIGRFKMLLISSGAGAVGVILMGLLAQPSTVYFLVLAEALSALLIWFGTPVIYHIANELYPTAIRGTGEGITVTGTRVAGLFGPFGSTLVLVASGHVLADLFYYNAIFLVLMFFITLLWLGRKIETTNRELEDISDGFLRRN